MSDKYPGGFVTAGAPAGFSVAFDGTGDYLTTPSSANLALGTGDFTFECWVYATSTPSDVGIFENRSNGNTGTVDGFTLTALSSSVIRIYSDAILIASSGTSYVNTWCHVAVTRVSGTFNLYINGVSQGTSATARTLSNTDAVIGGGRYSPTGAVTTSFPGYIANVRLIKGTAIYTGNFTPPTQLLAVTNTQLLTCQSPTIIDNSSNAFTVTANGNAAVSNFTPFAAYTGFNPALGAAAGGVWTLDEAAYYQQNRLWPIYDPYFNQTTLMLHGNGTNAAQNNTFLDSSVNNFTITRNGNTTQGSFSPFSQTGWSNFFNGSSYLTVNNAATQLALGTGDWQIEMWFFPNSLPGSGDNLLYDGRPGNGAYPMINVRGVSAASAQKVLYYTNTAVQITSDGTVPIGAWTHVMVSRVSSVTRMFINGVVQSQTYADTTNYLNDSTHPQLGRNAVSNVEFWNGYMANVRVLKGSGTSTSFTPSTAPLTATTNTVLLTCQSNRLLDNSANNFSITDTGSGSIQAFSPFVPAYITPTTYSNYFDGTGDYLSVPDNAALEVGSSSFTVEAWVYATANQGNGSAVISKAATSAYTPFMLALSGAGNMQFYCSISGSGWDITTGDPATFPLNRWVHVAGVRNGTTFTLYINGVAVGTPATSSSSLWNNTESLLVGWINYPSASWVGCISNVRLVIGTAVYTGNFTPPTAPLTAITNTAFLSCQSSTFIDNSTNNFTITANGNVQPVTSPTPFPAKVDTTTLNSAYSTSLIGGSGYFDGTGDSLSLSSTSLNLGSSDFTIETWVYATTTARDCIIGSISDAAGLSAWMLMINEAGYPYRFYCRYNGGSTLDYLVGSGNFPVNQWTHFAVTRNGANVRIFINGAQVGTTSTTLGANSIDNATTPYYFGRTTDDTANFTGYLSGTRVVVGTALYTSNFAPPIAPATPSNLTNNGTQSGTLTFVVGSDAPNTLYYVCQNHSAMAGVINIVNSGTYEKVYAVTANGSSNYVINGSSNPTLTLVRGETYTFNVNATGHPFWITKASGAYSAGNVYLGTTLLTNFTNGAIFDNTAKNVLETVGNAQISTTQSKWGGSSMYFDSSGDCLSIPYSPTTAFGTGDFTMEAWVYPLSWPNYATIIGGNGVTNSMLWGKYDTVNSFGVVNDNVAWIITDGTLPTINTWSHVALVRSGTTMKMYVNGVQTGSTATNSSNFVGSVRIVGARNTSAFGSFDGYIEDVRITTGVARYITNFTPPTSLLQNQ